MRKPIWRKFPGKIALTGILLFSALLSAGCDNSELTGQSNNPPGEFEDKGLGESCSAEERCAFGLECMNGVCQEKSVSNNNPNNENNHPNNDDNNNENNNSGPQDCAKKNICGHCEVSCQVEGAGPDSRVPFDPEASGNTGVVADDDGNITIEMPGMGTKKEFIWISNTSQGTISKVDTKTYEEVGRYLTGPKGSGNDPSRTSVDTYSDVYVGNRNGGSLTKIGNGATCVDKNGDGEIQTSTGADNILPWGEDECVLWNTELSGGGLIRAVAAQDGPDGPVVWAGGYNGVIWKLDGTTGEILLRTESPVPTYGFALDKSGNLWIATLSSLLGRVDTNRCVDEASCNVAICGDDGDTCVKQRIATPASTYGITVDYKQRVWLGGRIQRYEPNAPLGSRFVNLNIGAQGIAADENGWIYGAAQGTGIHRINADNPDERTIIEGTPGGSAYGIGVALDGNVWGINISHNTAFVIDPGAGLHDGQVIHTQPGFVYPYTYSDMTGSQLRLATNRQGIFTQTFEGCSPEHYHYNEWEQLHYNVIVPDGASMKIRVRVAHSEAELASAPWLDAVDLPGASSPLDLKALLEPFDLHRHQYLQVEIQLNAYRDENILAVPVLKGITTRAECPLILG